MKRILAPVIIFLGVCAAETGHAGFTTWDDLRFRGIVRQGHDFSCGVASLVTLFNHQFGDESEEDTVLRGYLDDLDPEKRNDVVSNGLTMLDLKIIGERAGYRVDAVRIDLLTLTSINRPALVYIEDHDFRHFAVFRGLRGVRVLLADPAVGNRVMFVEQFMSIWKGQTALFLSKPDENVLDELLPREPATIEPGLEMLRNIMLPQSFM